MVVVSYTVVRVVVSVVASHICTSLTCNILMHLLVLLKDVMLGAYKSDVQGTSFLGAIRIFLCAVLPLCIRDLDSLVEDTQ